MDSHIPNRRCTLSDRKLVIAMLVATMCLLLGLLFLADSSAQMAVRADASFHRSDAVPFVAASPHPDDYEDDDAQHKAKLIEVNDPDAQRHNFHDADDEDWVKFWAWAGNVYAIRTFKLDFGCDTVVGLYDTEDHKLRENDDRGEEPRASRIDDWTPSENGTYYVKVSQYQPTGGNLWYSLQITDSVACKDNFEPDDPRDDAKEITVGESQAHSFHGPCGGDEDWVWFEAVGGNAYVICTFNLEGSNDTTLKLYRQTSNGDLVKVAENDDYPDDIPASKIIWEAPENGTYYVKVSPFEPSAGKSCAGRCNARYSLNLATLSSLPLTPTPTPPPREPDEYEPDDAMYQANRIPINSPHQVHTFHRWDDKDWVKFWAWEGNDYTIRTFDLESGNNTTLRLYDVEGHKLKEDVGPGGSEIDWTAPEDGKYFVRVAPPKVGVSGYYGLSSSDGLSYSLEVRETIPCRDEYEPDDACREAERITVGEMQHRNFHVPCFNSYHSPDAADWVKFEATKGFTYTIKTSHLEGSNDTKLCLYDGNCNPLDVCNDDDPDNIPASKIVWGAPEDGTYYVKVSPFDHCAGGCDVSYILEVAPWIASLELTVSPPKVPAYGVEGSTLTACVEDKEGEPVEGVTVCFTSTLGTPSPVSTPTLSSGCATSYLTSTIAGTAVVTATVGRPISDTKEVTFVKYAYLPLVLKPPPNQLPYTPSEPSPPHDVTDQSIDVRLDWSGGDPDPEDTVSYTVHLGSSSPPPLKETIGPYPATQTPITYEPECLLSCNTIYYWQIVVRDNQGAESEGPEWHFTTFESVPCPTTLEELGPICSGIPYQGLLCEPEKRGTVGGNSRWYFFDLGTQTPFAVDLTVPDVIGSDYDIYILDADTLEGAVTAARDRQWDETGWHSDQFGSADEHIDCTLGPGRYYIRVRCWGNPDPDNPYTLTATYE